MSFQPAFEATRVDSMQWNRTFVDFELPEQPAVDRTPMEELPAAVLDQLREALSTVSSR